MLTSASDFTLLEIIDWLKEANPGVITCDPSNLKPVLVSKKPIVDLKIPKGWYFQEGNLTNRGNSISGISHTIEVCQIFPP